LWSIIAKKIIIIQNKDLRCIEVDDGPAEVTIKNRQSDALAELPPMLE
jgi:hypothetical protein